MRPPKKTVIWNGSGVGSTVVGASGRTLVSVLNASALLLRPFTILRTRMLVGFQSDQTGASEIPFGSLGIIVVTDTAAGIGVTAIPDPGSITGDPSEDWFVHQPVLNPFQFVSGVGVEHRTAQQYIVDSKAMRKVGPNDQVVHMFGMEAAVGGTLFTQGRQLIQLH